MGKGQVWSREPQGWRAGAQGWELGGCLLWDSKAGLEGQGGCSRGGYTPGGKEWLLLNGWEGSWSESESESHDGCGGLKHRCSL